MILADFSCILLNFSSLCLLYMDVSYTFVTTFFLPQVINYERDIKKAKEGETEDLAYKKIAGFNEDLTGTVHKPEILQEDDVSDSGEGSSANEDEDKGQLINYLFFFHRLLWAIIKWIILLMTMQEQLHVHELLLQVKCPVIIASGVHISR